MFLFVSVVYFTAEECYKIEIHISASRNPYVIGLYMKNTMFFFTKLQYHLVIH